jgi:hypothetical protein
MSIHHGSEVNMKREINNELFNSPKTWTNSKKEFHREDGPALEYDDGDKEWAINGSFFSKDDWLQWLKDGHSSLSTNEVTRLILEWS